MLYVALTLYLIGAFLIAAVANENYDGEAPGVAFFAILLWPAATIWVFACGMFDQAFGR